MTKTTLSGNPDDGVTRGAPQSINPKTGMHKDYWILSEEERSKGFIRPVRDSYRHVGVQPKYPIRDLTEDEKERHKPYGYIAFEEYPESKLPLNGRFWTSKQLSSGCGTITTMHSCIAETYARKPNFYGSTFCSYCGKHFPVGENGEFIWNNGTKVGT